MAEKKIDMNVLKSILNRQGGDNGSRTMKEQPVADDALVAVMIQRATDRACEGGDENEDQRHSSESCHEFHGVSRLEQWCDMCLFDVAIKSIQGDAQVASQSPAPPDDEPFELDRLAQEQPRLLRQLAQIIGSRDLCYREPDDGAWTQVLAPSERRRIARMLNEIAATSPPRAQEWYEYPTTDDVMNHLRAARKRRTVREPR